MAALRYTREELLAEPAFAARLEWRGERFHGGLDAHGAYLPPRSLHRGPAIAAWTQALEAAGEPTEVISASRFRRQFFPNVAQSKLLLRHGARDAMTRILTLIGIVEGFGNDGLQAFPKPPLQPHFVEPLDATCLGHLYAGLFEAHGYDEAGHGAEAGHDRMWYAVRDAALDNPPVTDDMYENIPIAPPPGYTGPARPSAEALRPVQEGGVELRFPNLDPAIEILFIAMARLLMIEQVAFATFAWAQRVLGDPACSLEPEAAPRIVGYIQADERLHVGYLNCALAEARCRTLIGRDGSRIAGREVVDTIAESAIQRGFGTGGDRVARYRMQQIRRELAHRPDGDAILREFATLGPVPDAA